MIDEDVWVPTKNFRVLKLKGSGIVQQLWMGHPDNDKKHGEFYKATSKRQWRVLRSVDGDDLTEEERGITFVKDLPND